MKLSVYITEEIYDPTCNSRYFVICRDRTKGTSTGKDKTSLILETTHTCGALFNALSVWNEHKVNIVSLHSHYVGSSNNSRSLFYIELEGHETDDSVSDSIRVLKETKAFHVYILGSYATN